MPIEFGKKEGYPNAPNRKISHFIEYVLKKPLIPESIL